jgi:hypothetical protein
LEAVVKPKAEPTILPLTAMDTTDPLVAKDPEHDALNCFILRGSRVKRTSGFGPLIVEPRIYENDTPNPFSAPPVGIIAVPEATT